MSAASSQESVDSTTGSPEPEGGSELEVGEANLYNALRAGDGGSSRLNQILTPEAAVRRLTPRECERLQALPDDWTLVPDDAPDSRRYAGLGDAVTASVGEWIGLRLRPEPQEGSGAGRTEPWDGSGA